MPQDENHPIMETFWAHDAVHCGDGVGLVLVHGDDGVLGGVVVLAGAVLRFWPGLELREGVGYWPGLEMRC